MRTLMVPFQQGQGILRPQGAFGSTRPVGEARVYFAPFGSMEPSSATYPRRGGQIERSIDDVMERSKYERTWELVEADAGGVRHAAGLHPRGRRLPAPARVPLRGAPAGHARRRGAAGLLHQRVPPRLLPALRGRDGPDAADGRHPGARRDRLLARRLLREQEGLDRPRHRRPCLGRGVVRPVRLGHGGPHAVRHSRPLPRRLVDHRRAGLRAPASDSGDDSAPAPNDGTNPQAVRPDLQVGTDGSVAGTGDDSGWRWLLWFAVVVLALALVLAVVLFIRRPRGATPMDRAIAEVEDALRRVGRPVSTGTTLRELERRLGVALARGGRVPAFSVVGAVRGGLRAALARRAARAAAGVGARARVRRRLRALWALPPRVERGWPRDTARTLEVDTSVRRVAELSASARGSGRAGARTSGRASSACRARSGRRAS